MADEAFAIGLAIGSQSAFGTPNSTIAGLSGSLGVTDGILLGDKASGDAESGIAIPAIEGVYREVAAVAGSFTESADAFLRAAVNGMQVSFPLQGNGVTSTPSSGQAQPLAGIHAFLHSAGLIGAAGTAPVYAYTPRHNASSGGATIYATIKLWIADLSFVFTDCLIESCEIAFTPGGNGIVTGTIRVGKHSPSTDFADGVTFPTFAYGTQASLAAPTVAGVNHTWGQVRGFEELKITIQNEIEEFGDSNVATTGIRESQVRRQILVDGTIYVATADSDFDYQSVVSAVAPTVDMSFQVGTVAAPAATLNAYLVAVNNVQAKSTKFDRRGTALVATLSGAKATATTAGAEFSLTFN
jgi:hypothetical protein